MCKFCATFYPRDLYEKIYLYNEVVGVRNFLDVATKLHFGNNFGLTIPTDYLNT